MSTMIKRMTPPMGLSADEKEFRGYAIVFYNSADEGTQYRLDTNLVERISRNAADDLVKNQSDVIISFNHDINTILGRTKNGTAELSIDSKGVQYRCEFDKDDPDHVRIARKIERGLISGSSFMGYFKDVEYAKDGNQYVRQVNAIDMVECGPVVMPAYQSTSTGFRSAGPSDLITAKQELELYLTQLAIEDIQNL